MCGINQKSFRECVAAKFTSITKGQSSETGTNEKLTKKFSLIIVPYILKTPEIYTKQFQSLQTELASRKARKKEKIM